LFDVDQPIGVLMLWVLQFIPDSWYPVNIMTRYRDRLAPGSYLAISHVTEDSTTPGLDEVLRLYRDTQDPMYARNHGEVLRLSTGFDLVDPGLVGHAFWRPSRSGDVSDDAHINAISYLGIGRKL
jgi:hypothetical protein